MNKEKQIREMARDICENCRTLTKCDKDICTMAYKTTEHLIEKGWKKEIQGEWVSVEDKLPQENEKVLAINSEGEIFIATYLVHKVSPSARGYKTWASGLWNGTPTHWQPLPQPPKMRGE